MDLFALLNMRQLVLPSALAAGTGVLAHLIYFIRGYRVPEITGIIWFHLINEAAIFIVSTSIWGLWIGLLFTLTISASYYTGLTSSIITYRVFFHPLKHFPGPLPAKIWKLSNVFIARHLEYHQNEWIKRYGGSIIRVGKISHGGLELIV